VVELRRKFESSEVGLIGARAIWGKLIELKVKPLPSERSLTSNGAENVHKQLGSILFSSWNSGLLIF
jgi:hypothetical protein